MQLTLDFNERIGAYIILQQVNRGPRGFLNVVKDAKETLEVKKDEIAEYGVIPRPGGGLDWDKEKSKVTKEFTISEGAYNYIKSRLEEMDKGEMDIEFVAIANKILGEPQKNG